LKVTAVDYNTGIIQISDDHVTPSTGFIFDLAPTINITPISSSAPGIATVSCGDIIGDIGDQADLVAALATKMDASVFDAKGDILAGTAADAFDNLTVGTDGSFLRAKAAQATGLEWQKNNFAAAVAPTTGDDSDDGYSIGSRWLDTTSGAEYVCLSATVGAASWLLTTPGIQVLEILPFTNLPAANVADILNIPATYKTLHLIVSAVSFDTTTRNLEVVWSSNNGTTWSTNGIDGHSINGTTVSSHASVAHLLNHATQANTVAGVFTLTIEGYSNALLPLLSRGCGYSADATVPWSTQRSTRGAAAVLNALRLRCNASGNFDAGVYGLWASR